MRSRQTTSRSSAASPVSPSSRSRRARSSSSVEVYSDCSVSETNEYSGIERGREQLLLERLQAREVGAERHDTEVGLVPEHRDAQRLVAVGFERRDRVDDPLGRAGLALGALTIDAVVEVQDAPTDRRCHRFHTGEVRRRARSDP